MANGQRGESNHDGGSIVTSRAFIGHTNLRLTVSDHVVFASRAIKLTRADMYLKSGKLPDITLSSPTRLSHPCSSLWYFRMAPLIMAIIGGTISHRLSLLRSSVLRPLVVSGESFIRTVNIY